MLLVQQASDAVDSATATMDKAITTLAGASGDRKSAWNLLVDSCRIMSGRTIRLLEIVYGADNTFEGTAALFSELVQKAVGSFGMRTYNGQERPVLMQRWRQERSLPLAPPAQP